MVAHRSEGETLMTDTRAMPDRCQALAKGGSQCGAKPRPGRNYCLWHDDAEDAVEKRRAISQKGGQARSNKARARKALPAEPLTNEEVHAWLGLAFKAVIGGRMAPGVGSAAATIAKVMADLNREVELEQRIVALEQAYERKRA
jgi:hypothetical protein